jgi:nicotinate-nucleotide pyrophosphorylase (carboxylating)
MKTTRQRRLEQALCRGANLTLDNASYRNSVRVFTNELLRTDLAGGDLTAEALGLKHREVSAASIAREGGVVAGLQEFAFLVERRGVVVESDVEDGDAIRPGQVLLRASGEESKVLSVERVGLNLLQRLSGIATMSRCLQQRVSARHPGTLVVGTRKTPWGLLDKRGLHFGSGGTHRLGLGDAILIKNNHLALIAGSEEEAAPAAIQKAWARRDTAAFIEVEVRGLGAARAAAATFRRLHTEGSEPYPCLSMLDNMTPEQAGLIVEMLHRENLWEHTLIEASGGISETNVEAYAASGVDAISIGALTHSARALDISQTIS